MQIKPRKTIRFAALVAAAGSPELVTLWGAPETDRAFMKAVREGRVVTIIQRNVGNKADYGLVGFVQQAHAAFLVFPRKVPYAAETKVIGIKYEAVSVRDAAGPVYKPKARSHLPGIRMRESRRWQPEPEPNATSRQSSPARQRPTKKAPERPHLPKARRFRAEVEIVSRRTVPLQVEARTKSEAERLIKSRMRNPDFAAAGEGKVIRRVVRRVREVS